MALVLKWTIQLLHEEKLEHFPEEQSSSKKRISHILHMCLSKRAFPTSLQTCKSDAIKELLFKLTDFQHTNSFLRKEDYKTTENQNG